MNRYASILQSIEDAKPRYEVVPSRCWYNAITGATASLYGACPWVSDAEKDEWTLTVSGWTIKDNQRGTVGIGRAPFKSEEEAEQYLLDHPTVFRQR